jgi:uncharacterized protein (TIGR02266 family)
MFVREHTRYPVELAVRMKCGTWADYLELHTSNLSRGGLFVPSRMTAPVGTELAIELTLPNGTIVELPGEVVHVSDGGGPQVAGLGVMFAPLDAETQRALEEALKLAKTSAGQPALPEQQNKRPSPPPAPPPRPVASPPKPVASPPKPVAPPPKPVASPPKPVAPPPKPVAPPPKAVAPPPPAPKPPEARAPKFADVVEQALLDELARRLELRPHEQLGVPPDANDADIEEAYTRLKERYAPTIFARNGSSTAAVVKSINDGLDGAHKRLRDPSARRALVIAAHQPKLATLSPAEEEQKRRGEEARAALRAGIDRRVEEACAHRDMDRLDDAIRGFESVLELDRKHEFARAQLLQLRDLKAKRKR